MSFIDAGRWRDHLERNPRLAGSIEFVCEDSKGRVGVWTTHDKKIQFANELQKSVPTMTFAKEFITTRDSPNKIQADIIDQMRNFRREVVAPVGDHMTALHNKIVVTGKSPGKKDDLIMALCIAIYQAFKMRCDLVFQKRMRERSLLV